MQITGICIWKGVSCYITPCRSWTYRFPSCARVLRHSWLAAACALPPGDDPRKSPWGGVSGADSPPLPWTRETLSAQHHRPQMSHVSVAGGLKLCVKWDSCTWLKSQSNKNSTTQAADFARLLHNMCMICFDHYAKTSCKVLGLNQKFALAMPQNIQRMRPSQNPQYAECNPLRCNIFLQAVNVACMHGRVLL